MSDTDNHIFISTLTYYNNNNTRTCELMGAYTSIQLAQNAAKFSDNNHDHEWLHIPPNSEDETMWVTDSITWYTPVQFTISQCTIDAVFDYNTMKLIPLPNLKN